MGGTVRRCVLSLLVLIAPTTALAQGGSHSFWYARHDSDTVMVFVHGIFSDSRSCWTSANGQYWPQLVQGDARFGDVGLYLGGYTTAMTSGLYDLAAAADEVWSHLRTSDQYGRPAPMSKKHIVFVAHSMGGIIVRYIIDRHREQFQDKTVGLLLLASPSRGSDWPDRLAWLNEYFSNKMVTQLRRNQDFVNDLDVRFAEDVHVKKLPGLVGQDAFESRFIGRKWFLGMLPWNYVVDPSLSSSYFGAYRSLPEDHFSIAKPTDAGSGPHQLLWDFFTTRFGPARKERIALASKAETAPVSEPAATRERNLTPECRATYSTANVREDAKPESGWWVSGAYAPQQATFNCVTPRTVSRMVFTVQQAPTGDTVHELYVNGSKIHEFSGSTHHGQDLVFPPTPMPPLTNVMTVSIKTIKSPSWVSWGGVYLFGY